MIFSFLAACAFSGCREAAEPTEIPDVTIAVASSLEEAASALLAGFSSVYPQGNPFLLQTIPDKDFSAAFNTGDISAAIQWQEPPAEVWSARIGWTGICFAVHPDNSVGNISSSQVRAIFSGLTSNWEDVGGSFDTIHVLAFDEGSPWAALFNGVVLTGGMLTGSAMIIPAAGAMPSAIAADPEAIGYLPMVQKGSGVRILTIDGAAADYPGLLSGAYPFRIPIFLLGREPVSKEIVSFAGWAQSVAGQMILMEIQSRSK